MGLRCVLLVCVVCALTGAGVRASAAAPKSPKTTWDPSPQTNYERAHRKPGHGDIRYIVIHVSEGSYLGTISWLTNEHAHVSSHYVVSRGGDITQIVARRNIAWHSGNHAMNAESIGIEHEGVTDDPAGFTDAEYKASARLVAWLVHVYDIPIDREHIIGHSDVADPTDPTQGGGIDHHTDPGRYWDWSTYLRLVRRYANGPTVPLPKLTPVGIIRNRPVAGIVTLHARVRYIRRVDFFVDRRLLMRDAAPPFGVHWNTNSVHNGRHTLVVRAYGRGRHARTVVSRIPFVVANQVLGVGIRGVTDHAFVDKSVRLFAAIRNGPARTVTFLVDRHVVARSSRAPFAFRWNGARAAEGLHVLELRARSGDGRTASRKVTVRVAHSHAAIVGESLQTGQTVQGSVVWSVTVHGAVRRIEWLIDGELRWTSTSLPFVFGGKDATWDTARETPGQHELTVRAVRPDGTATELTIAVTVAAP